MLLCSAVFAQNNSITLPETVSQIKSKQLLSKVIFSKIASGGLKIYTTAECKKIMTLKQFKKNITDSTIVNTIDPESGEITGTKTKATLYEPDSLINLSVYKPSKTETTLGFMKPIYTTTGVLIGHSTPCYFKYEDVKKIITEFETRNYPTGFKKQIQRYL